MNENQANYLQQVNKQVCPTCGTCPTCGKKQTPQMNIGPNITPTPCYPNGDFPGSLGISGVGSAKGAANSY